MTKAMIGIAWLTVVLMIVPGRVLFPDSASTDTAEGNPATRVLWLTVLAVSAAAVLARMTTVLKVLKQVNVFFLALFVLAILSVAWSIDPAATARRAVRLLTLYSAFFAIASTRGWAPLRFQTLVRPVMTLLLLGSLVYGLVDPVDAIHQETAPELLNAWRGLANQKNALGTLSSFGFILWLHALLARQVRLASAMIGAGAAAACLILSRSSTALMATVFTSLALLLLMRTPGSMRRSMPYLVAGLTGAILIYSLAMLQVVPGLSVLLSPIPMITGKDLTFSGRAAIWAAIVDHIRMRPLLGSGYGAYWAIGAAAPGTESYVLLDVLRGFYPGSAHNGYLDVINDLGAVGFVCLIGYLIVYIRDSLRLYAVDRPAGALFLALFMQQAIANLSETHWFLATSFDFVVMSFATTSMARIRLERRDAGRQSARTVASVVAAPVRPAPSPPPRRPPGRRTLAPPRRGAPKG